MKKEVVIPAELKWKGGTVAEARIRDMTLLMDSPPHEKEGGKSLGLSATETFVLAIGRCQLVSTLKAAKALGVEMRGLSLALEMRDREQEPGVYSFEKVTVRVNIDADADERTIGKILRESHKYCAVGRAVKEGLIKLELDRSKG